MKAKRPLSWSSRGVVSRPSGSSMLRHEIVTVRIRTSEPSMQRTFNCVSPKKPNHFGRSMKPSRKPRMFPTPPSRVAQAFAESC